MTERKIKLSENFERGFTVIDHRWWESGHLSVMADAMPIYFYLLKYAGCQQIFPSIDIISQATGYERKRVTNKLKMLRMGGYIDYQRKRVFAKWESIYIITNKINQPLHSPKEDIILPKTSDVIAQNGSCHVPKRDHINISLKNKSLKSKTIAATPDGYAAVRDHARGNIVYQFKDLNAGESPILDAKENSCLKTCVGSAIKLANTLTQSDSPKIKEEVAKEIILRKIILLRRFITEINYKFGAPPQMLPSSLILYWNKLSDDNLNRQKMAHNVSAKDKAIMASHEMAENRPNVFAEAKKLLEAE